jgi:hypothetical protein
VRPVVPRGQIGVELVRLGDGGDGRGVVPQTALASARIRFGSEAAKKMGAIDFLTGSGWTKETETPFKREEGTYWSTETLFPSPPNSPWNPILVGSYGLESEE